MGVLTEEQKRGIAESAIRMEEEREVRREALEQRAIQKKQEAMGPSLAMDCGKAARQAYWSEVPLDEKCERLRSEVKRLQREMGQMRETFALLLIHDHNAKGEIVATLDSIRTSGIRDQGGGTRVCGPGKDDVYF